MIFGDEMAFMPEDIFFLIIVPLLEMSLIMLIGISTSGGQTNFYTSLINLRNDAGEKLFLTYVHELVCKSCLERKIGTECRHKIEEIPPWKDVKGLDISKKLFEVANRQTDMFQESLYVCPARACSFKHSCIYIAVYQRCHHRDYGWLVLGRPHRRDQGTPQDSAHVLEQAELRVHQLRPERRRNRPQCLHDHCSYWIPACSTCASMSFVLSLHSWARASLRCSSYTSLANATNK